MCDQTLIMYVNNLNELLDTILLQVEPTPLTPRIYVLKLDTLIRLENSLQALLQLFSDAIEKSKKNIKEEKLDDLIDYLLDNKNISDHFYKLFCISDYLHKTQTHVLLYLEINRYLNMFD